MKQFIVLFLLVIQIKTFAQNYNVKEKQPVFPGCENIAADSLKICFNQKVLQYIKSEFKVPENVQKDKYKGEISVIFEVDTLGVFKLIYVNTLYKALKEETERVFKTFPKIEPASYNGRKTFKQYSLPIKIPLRDYKTSNTENIEVTKEVNKLEAALKSEYDDINRSISAYNDNAFTSQLNVQFTHSDYAKFDRQMNLVGTNSHTASKPFLYNEVSNYYDFKAEKEKVIQSRKTWFGKKLWNEHMVELQGKNYWFTIDPIFDLEVGKDTEADFNSTYNNTRGLLVKGALGKRFSFYTSVFESQGRFAQYFNEYAETLQAFGPDPAIIPGRGIAKAFKTDSYDYPVAEAYLSYSPADFVNVQFGHGKNFIGDGYRSLFLSDVASPHPFFKLNTKFWKIKYTNTWMWLKDVRPEVTVDDAFLTKYMATHFLSWNVTKRLNVGFFESIIWANTTNRNFDINYLNPIVFYRAVEFETGQDAGNAIMGASAKYKYNDNINLYSQFILDEFSLSDVRAGNKSWKNKFGYQLGVKYYNAFKVENLMLQIEYNRVRPYTYSHSTIATNYGHNNQSMAHLWGANFSELIVMGNYFYNRWYANAKFIFGKRGFDYNDDTDNFSYGGDIYKNYNDRPFDTGVEIGQGITTNSFYGNLQAGYVVNPSSNLKLFTDITVRNFNPEATTEQTYKSNTVWFNFGLRTDLFNWYFDY
ncbi:gliding motility protein RemB [Neotamlana laminarinivorans]|uniref:Gliding motility protein RemB n=1 Tax=Neotamlana laminarinivorans TaxID=2883124 RepID=A0A9X1L2L2_9FLAO|nr:gliding motility protein RemB [Tamlana laminarinivorans]MCB4799888.1 gliding motility protein RemB [Tamlana laminarinivorans]